MHTYEASNGTVFNYNADGSGMIRIRCPVAKVTQQSISEHAADPGFEWIWIPGDDLAEFEISQTAKRSGI